MRIHPMQTLEDNAFMNDYRSYTPNMSYYFDYNPFEESTYQNRIRDLKQETYQRERLAETLHRQNRQ